MKPSQNGDNTLLFTLVAKIMCQSRIFNIANMSSRENEIPAKINEFTEFMR